MVGERRVDVLETARLDVTIEYLLSFQAEKASAAVAVD